jgi:hypothetical protein
VPDTRLAGLAPSLEQLLADDEALLLDRPHGLTTAERERLRASVPEIASAAHELASYGIPGTLQHDDLHDGNVFVRDGCYLIFDWGDSSVSHPFHSLVVTFRAIVHRFELDIRPGGHELLSSRDAYLEPFSRFGTPTSSRPRSTSRTPPGRSPARSRGTGSLLPGSRSSASMTAETVPYGLKRMLDLGPLGSWS